MAVSRFEAHVRPRFLADQSSPADGVYAFAYTIRITNTGNQAAQLIARHWVVRDARGRVQEVRGLGVVGQQPLLQPGETFEYTSGCQLQTASGSMQGSYLCVSSEGETFDCPVAAFVLDAMAQDDADAPPHDRVLH
ncbi:Co2+/Mg2+ efflux protein ApaG [Comamonas faecalis]|uniref:Protein ApaG n=1 Tax=Comamonas faecalis TaxID=1387849 RepID=A0ABP7QPY1_9BURK